MSKLSDLLSRVELLKEVECEFNEYKDNASNFAYYLRKNYSLKARDGDALWIHDETNEVVTAEEAYIEFIKSEY